VADITQSNHNATDASNTTASPDGMPEGMNPSGVNDWARAFIGAVKRWYNWTIPATTGGTTTAYTLTYTPAVGALADGMPHRVLFNATNGTAPTLNVNSLGARAIHKYSGGAWGAVASGDIVANSVHLVVYNLADTSYRIVSSAAQITSSTETLTNKTINSADNTLYAAMVPQGRLTLTSATPVLTANVASATAIYYALYSGNLVPIYDGTGFKWTAFAELTNTTTDNTKNPAAVTTNSNYDLFVWNDAGTIRLGRGPAWTSDAGRGTGAGTTELERVNGLLVNKIAITNGPAAQRGTYVGTVRSDGSSQINWHVGAVAANGTAGLLNVWNAYNRVTVEGHIGDTTDSWNYSTATARPSNNSSTMRVSFVQGLQEDSFWAEFANQSTNGSQQILAYAGIGYDSTTAFSGRWSSNANPVGVGSGIFTAVGSHRVQALGFHYMQAMENTAATGTTTWYGDAGGASQNGLTYRGRF